MTALKIPDELKVTLAAARVNTGMTQTQVAKAIGVSKNTIVAWENGKTDIPVKMADKLCALYKRPIDSINFFIKESR